MRLSYGAGAQVLLFVEPDVVCRPYGIGTRKFLATYRRFLPLHSSARKLRVAVGRSLSRELIGVIPVFGRLSPDG